MVVDLRDADLLRFTHFLFDRPVQRGAHGELGIWAQAYETTPTYDGPKEKILWEPERMAQLWRDLFLATPGLVGRFTPEQLHDGFAGTTGNEWWSAGLNLLLDGRVPREARRAWLDAIFQAYEGLAEDPRIHQDIIGWPCSLGYGGPVFHEQDFSALFYFPKEDASFEKAWLYYQTTIRDNGFWPEVEHLFERIAKIPRAWCALAGADAMEHCGKSPDVVTLERILALDGLGKSRPWIEAELEKARRTEVGSNNGPNPH